MTQPLYYIFAVVLLLAVTAGMVRILKGPTAADRMMAAQLFGTCGIAILLIFSQATANPVLLDIALIFALLAVLSTTTFIRRVWFAEPDKGGNNDES